jgi:hypothetical protein
MPITRRTAPTIASISLSPLESPFGDCVVTMRLLLSLDDLFRAQRQYGIDGDSSPGREDRAGKRDSGEQA